MIDGTMLRRNKANLIKTVINSFQDEDDVNEAENVHIQRMLEREYLGEGRKSKFFGKSRRSHNQHLTGTLSLHTLEWLLKRRAEHLWECPTCCEASF